MSMSKFASQADYWKDRAEAAEKELAGLRVLAAEPHAIQRVRDTLGPLSLWSQNSLEHHVAEKIKEALAMQPEELLRSREIFRDAFAHISMNMNEDGAHYFMPRNEWDSHAAVQDAVAEETRLIASQCRPQHCSEEKP